MRTKRTMTWNEIDEHWAGLRKRHRMEIAHAVADYCVGHKVSEVAERLGFGISWMRRQLDYAGIGDAVGGGSQLGTPPGTSGDKGVDHAVSRLVREYKPHAQVTLSDNGKGKQSVASVDGEDAELYRDDYLQPYMDQGHEPAAAIRLANAKWAAEEAVEAGVIKEDVGKQNERVNRILFPDQDKDDFQLNLASHMNRVKQAAKFLDAAKVNLLRRKSSCKEVAKANVMWQEQMDRMANFHSDFLEVS